MKNTPCASHCPVIALLDAYMLRFDFKTLRNIEMWHKCLIVFSSLMMVLNNSLFADEMKLAPANVIAQKKHDRLLPLPSRVKAQDFLSEPAVKLVSDSDDKFNQLFEVEQADDESVHSVNIHDPKAKLDALLNRVKRDSMIAKSREDVETVMLPIPIFDIASLAQ